jgi:hypothetical protein
MWRTLKPTSEWSVSMANVCVSWPVTGVWMAVLMVVLLVTAPGQLLGV